MARKDPRSAMFRFGVVCGGSTLHAQQPLNNAVRVAYQAMASVLGGVQSMFTAAWDEPFALPTEESATFALRTQQVLAYETGVARTVDPLGGSYSVEALTDAMEAPDRPDPGRRRGAGRDGATPSRTGTSRAYRRRGVPGQSG